MYRAERRDARRGSSKGYLFCIISTLPSSLTLGTNKVGVAGILSIGMYLSRLSKAAKKNPQPYPFTHAAFDPSSAVFLITVGLVSIIVLSTKRERILDRPFRYVFRR